MEILDRGAKIVSPSVEVNVFNRIGGKLDVSSIVLAAIYNKSCWEN